MSWSRSGVSRWPMLVTWTTCSAAPARGRIPASLAQVHEAGYAVARGDPEQAQDLLATRARRIGDPEPNAERSFDQPLLDQRIEAGQLALGNLAVRPAAARVAQG